MDGTPRPDYGTPQGVAIEMWAGGSEFVTSRESQKPGSLNPIVTKYEFLMSYNFLRAFLVKWVDHMFWDVLK
jgi:hypothetical protein